MLLRCCGVVTVVVTVMVIRYSDSNGGGDGDGGDSNSNSSIRRDEVKCCYKTVYHTTTSDMLVLVD